MDDLAKYTVSGCVAAVVGSLSALVSWAFGQRKLEARDAERKKKEDERDDEVRALRVELKDLRDEKFKALTATLSKDMADLKERLIRETEGRRNIHQRLDEDFARTVHVTAVEQQLSELGDVVADVKSTADKTASIVGLIAQHMKINFGGS